MTARPGHSQTPQGHIPLTALPSLPPSLSLVQLPPVPLAFRPTSSTDSDPPLEAADYRHHEPLLIQNINLRRLGLGGRAGFRLPPSASSASSSKHAPVASGATPAQQLHFLQAYQLPVPPPSTSPPSSSASTSLALPLAARPPAPRDFTRTVLALGRTVQHALALFGLGPVKAYLASSVVRVVQLRRRDGARAAPGAERAAHGDGNEDSGVLDRDMIERALLVALLDHSSGAAPGSSASTAGSSSRTAPPPSPGVELVLEDWAEALGLALPPASASSAASPLGSSALGGSAQGPTLLEGDGLLCDTTVAALSVFRLAYAERFVASAGARAAGARASGGASDAAGASRLLDDDGSLLPPALLAALLSLVVATRGKMVVLGGVTGTSAGEGASAGAAAGGAGSRSGTLRRRHGAEERRERDEEKVPKDPLAKRERFLRCVEAFQVRLALPLSRRALPLPFAKSVTDSRGPQRSHPSSFSHAAASSPCPPVLTPSFLAALSTLYASRHSPTTSLHAHAHPHSHLPHLPTSRVRGALSSALGSVLHPDRDRDSPSTAASEADTPSHSEHERDPHRHSQQQPRRRSAIPHPLTALHLPFGSRTRGGRGEHAETLDLEGFVRAYVLGDDEGEADEGGGRGARARVRRRRRRARGAGRAGASVRGLWDPEDEEDRARADEPGAREEDERARETARAAHEAAEDATDADSVFTARTGGTVQQQQQPAPASAVHAAAAPAHGSAAASSSSVSTGPVKFGRGVLRGVKEVAGRAGRKLGDELGLGSAEAAGESSDGKRTARDEVDEKEREGLGPPLVVVSYVSFSLSVAPTLACAHH